MKNFIFKGLVFGVLMLVFSCSKNKDGFQQTESGLKYKFIKSSNGAKPALGDRMIMRIAYKTEFDSIIFDSKSKSDSFEVEFVAPTYNGGVEEGFGMMSEGDSAIFKVSADSVFTITFHSQLPNYLKPGSALIFHVSIQKIIPKLIYDSLQNARDVAARRQEFENIEQFLKQNNMEVMPTENGAYMLTSKIGSGPFPTKGDSVFVTYTAKLLDGTIFDQATDKNHPLGFVLGSGAVLQGWEECLPQLNKGAVARLVIPSDLAYGDQQKGIVKPYSTLVFDVEVIKVVEK